MVLEQVKKVRLPLININCIYEHIGGRTMRTMYQQICDHFVIINGQQRGPVSLEQLKGLAICEVIDENSQVWLQGTPNWTDLKTCLSQLK